VRRSERLHSILIDSVEHVDKDGHTNVDPCVQASQRHFRQSRRLLDLNPDPVLSAAISRIHPLASLLYTYPTLPLLKGPAATGFNGTRAEERSYRDWYFRLAWECGTNYRAAGLYARSDVKTLWPDAHKLDDTEFATAKLLAQKLHFPREFVKHFYATLCDQLFAALGVSDGFLGVCACICQTYGVDFPMETIEELVKVRFASTACATERFWWWRLCYCRLVLMMSIRDVSKTSGPEADLWFPLFDEAVIAAIDVVNAARVKLELEPLFSDFEYEHSVPDPSSMGECIHGVHFIPCQQTVPHLPFLTELVLGESTTASASPLFVLYKKTLFSPSQGRMLGSVVYKCMSKHPYAWPQLASIAIAVLLGNYDGGSEHMQSLGARAAFVAMWHRMEHDGALQSDTWTYFSVFIGKCQTILSLLLRYSLLHAIRSKPVLLRKVSQTLEVGELWSRVSEAVAYIQKLWCANCSAFFNLCAEPSLLMSQLSELEDEIVAAFRGPLLKLCVRKQPSGFLEAIVKARKAQSPGELNKACSKCPCHIQTQMQCFLDREKDASIIQLLLDLVRRLPPLLTAVEPILVGTAVRAGFSSVEVEAVCALIDAFYFRKKPVFASESKEPAFQIVLSHIRTRMPRLHAFVMVFAALVLRSRRFVIIEAPAMNIIRRATLSPIRVLLCPWCENMANDVWHGGFSKLRADTMSNIFGAPVYCCKASKSANTPPCSCGCELMRETRACGLPDISFHLQSDEVLRGPTQLYMPCSQPGCPRIFGYAPELCAFDSSLGGFLCPVCSMRWRREQQRFVMSPAWRALFEVRFDSARVIHARAVMHRALDTNSSGLRKCDLCNFGAKRYVSRTAPGTGGKRRKRSTAKTNVKLPGWEFDLVLCEGHLEEKEFIDDLGRCQLRVKVDPACTRQGFCDCDNGLTTCSGRMNLPSVIARWNMRQESRKTSDYIAREYKKTPGLTRFIEDSRKMAKGEEVIKSRGKGGRPSRRSVYRSNDNKRQRH
jgi:hypothetical protein